MCVNDAPAAAELAVRNLVAALAQLADRGTVDDYLACFTADAVWDMPDNAATGVAGSVRCGIEEIAAGVHERRTAGVQGPGSNTMHAVGTTRVTLAPGGDRATAVSHWQFYGATTVTPTLLSVGRYDDDLRVVDGTWKLARRVVTVG